MDKIVLYKEDAVIQVVAMGVEGFANQNAWINKMLDAFSGMVTKNPLAYRAFGPFWWPLKKLLVSRQLLKLTAPDDDDVARVSFNNVAYDIAAAFMYQNYSIDNMLNMNSYITVDTESGDTIEYLLMDDEMEFLAQI